MMVQEIIKNPQPSTNQTLLYFHPKLSTLSQFDLIYGL